MSNSWDLGTKNAVAVSCVGLLIVKKVEGEGSKATMAVEVVVRVDSTTTSVFDEY